MAFGEENILSTEFNLYNQIEIISKYSTILKLKRVNFNKIISKFFIFFIIKLINLYF